jgi:hypothetical protein
VKILAKLREVARQQDKDHTGWTPIFQSGLCGLLFVSSCRPPRLARSQYATKIVIEIEIEDEDGTRTI